MVEDPIEVVTIEKIIKEEEVNTDHPDQLVRGHLGKPLQLKARSLSAIPVVKRDNLRGIVL